MVNSWFTRFRYRDGRRKVGREGMWMGASANVLPAAAQTIVPSYRERKRMMRHRLEQRKGYFIRTCAVNAGAILSDNLKELHSRQCQSMRMCTRVYR